jgi:TatD DNase family protein
MPPLVEDIENVLERAQAAGVGRIVTICTDEASLIKGLDISSKYPWVFCAASATPHDVSTIGESFFPLVEQEAKKHRLVAIGETGLDYYYKHSAKHTQQEHLLRYIDLAKRVHLPLIFHCREAFSDLFALTDAHWDGGPCVLHCFTGTLKEAKEVLDRGWFLSISGIATFKNAQELRDVIACAPLERLLVETDAPYLAPQSKRGQCNEPAYLVETAELIAALKNLPLEEVAYVTSSNAENFFVFKK